MSDRSAGQGLYKYKNDLQCLKKGKTCNALKLKWNVGQTRSLTKRSKSYAIWLSNGKTKAMIQNSCHTLLKTSPLPCTSNITENWAFSDMELLDLLSKRNVQKKYTFIKRVHIHSKYLLAAFPSLCGITKHNLTGIHNCFLRGELILFVGFSVIFFIIVYIFAWFASYDVIRITNIVK